MVMSRKSVSTLCLFETSAIMNEYLEKDLENLPTDPGVYIMYDSDDMIIYIGKAVNLRNRVRQYFNGGDGRAMLRNLVPDIAHFEWIITDSEMEALVLENNLIKEHRPKYNTLLKDDKTYPYIKITMSDNFPRLLITRKLKKDGALYFGPYTDAGAARQTMDALNKIYGIRTCSRKISANPAGRENDSNKNERACLNYHMGYCPAPCIGNISKEEYALNVEKAEEFLAGRNTGFLKLIEKNMLDASSELEFERAAEWKDILEAAEKTLNRQKITASNSDDRDMVALAVRNEGDEKGADAPDAVISVFFVREGKLMGREHFYMEVPDGEDGADIVSGFIRQYYANAIDIPTQICTQYEIDGAELLEKWLSERRGHKVSLKVPLKGDKEKLLKLAKKNAELVLGQDTERLKRERMRTYGASEELGRLAGIGSLHRVEAYDISNISGYDMVGSMVVFEDGRPKRNDYRKFRIKSLEGQNDYAALKEVLTRRFEHGLRERHEEGEKTAFSKFPDAILMDGGIGQVHIAREVMSELGLHIPICGMVKDDHHNTRGLVVEEEEVPIRKDSAVFHLITRIQDEAHRFAITFHRSLRSKGQVRSMLDMIPGIGPSRRKALMKSFSTIDDLRKADEDSIAAVPGMNRAAARNVYESLHVHEDDAERVKEDGK